MLILRLSWDALALCTLLGRGDVRTFLRGAIKPKDRFQLDQIIESLTAR